MSAAATDLLQTCLKLGLFSAKQLQELQARTQEQAIEKLLERDWLTPFQVERLRAGRGVELVMEPYVLLSELGQGGMGQVFKARHRHLKRLVALKVIDPDKVRDADKVKRFYR